MTPVRSSSSRPSSARAHLQLGMVLLASSSVDVDATAVGSALDSFTRAVQLAPTPPARWRG